MWPQDSQMHWTWIEQLKCGELVIDGPEAHHLLHVLRMRTGGSLALFDGLGNVADAVILETGRRDLRVRATEIRQPQCRLKTRLTVAAAPPKGDRLRTMVEKLTEMGVHKLILLETERSVTTPGEARVEKLRTSVVAACKQARRPLLMELQPLTSFNSVLHQIVAENLTPFAAHPHEEPKPVSRSDGLTPLLLIGPEGGFTTQEVSRIHAAGAQFMAWPDTILRTETAAVVFATVLLHSG